MSVCIVVLAACSSSPSSTDAGQQQDSGTPPVDSGQPVDSGTPDAGPPDAGPQDSGVADAGGGPAAVFYGANAAGDAGIVTPALLVDNDYSDDNLQVNPPMPSLSDGTFNLVMAGLQKQVGLPYSLWIVPGDGSGSNRPSSADLANVHLIIWYTGANDSTTGNGTLTAAQEAALIAWLNLGNNTLAIFSPSLVKDLGGAADWMTAPTDPLLSQQLKVALDMWDPQVAVGGNDVAWSTLTAFDVDGGAFPFTGTHFHVYAAASATLPAIPGHVSIVQADAGIDALATIQADPLANGSNITVPVVIGNVAAGTAGTSKLLFVGFPIENNAGGDAGESENTFFTRLGVYLGL